jgi:DNA-binding beta-propeller fold protein YncE
MPVKCRFGTLALWFVCLSSWISLFSIAEAGQYLVADRLLGRVLRYSSGGSYLGTLINDPTLGVGPTAGGISGITLSPNQSRLYVSDRSSNRIAVFSYNGSSASKLFDITAVSAAPSTLFVPATVLFSQDATKIYAANLGPFTPLPAGNTVAQLTPNGASAGPDLTGGPMVGRSGLAFNPAGDLLVSSFSLFGDGGVLRFNSGTNQFVPLVTDRPELRGAGNLLVVGNDLYVAAGGGGRVGKFNATTGAIVSSFGTSGYIPNLAFPASLALGPNGNSLLVGVLGATNGDSRVDEYDFNGNLLRVWASDTHLANFPGGDGQPPVASAFGFSEPTGIVFSTIPEPSSVVLVMSVMAILGIAGRGVTCRSRRT